MAEIKIQEKKQGGTVFWVSLLIVLIIIVVLILDGMEIISSPDWINNNAPDVLEESDINNY